MAKLPDVNGDVRKFLADNGITVYDYTKEIHAIKYKFPLFRRPGNPVGLVLHNTSGMIELQNLVPTWQKRNVPSHFAVDQLGRVGQYVMLDFSDRATEGTLRHVSIELQAVKDGDITTDQVRSAACIAGFVHGYFGTPLKIANSKTEEGIAHHALFVDPKNPNGHFACPGPAIIGRKGEIVKQGTAFAAKLKHDQNPTGQWWVRVPAQGGLYRYDFDVNGNVRWTDPNNKKTGVGLWTIEGSEVRIKWTATGSTDKWQLPLFTSATSKMKGVDYELTAERVA
jgi:hypothetical protein